MVRLILLVRKSVCLGGALTTDEAGAEVASVAYNPTTVVGDAVAAGWVEFQREDHANLVEVVYTR